MENCNIVSALKTALETKNPDDLFIFMYLFHYMEFTSWQDVEDVVKSATGESPDWHKCKRLKRERGLK